MEYVPLDEVHPIYGPFFGVMGAAAAIIFTCKYCKNDKEQMQSYRQLIM